MRGYQVWAKYEKLGAFCQSDGGSLERRKRFYEERSLRLGLRKYKKLGTFGEVVLEVWRRSSMEKGTLCSSMVRMSGVESLRIECQTMEYHY